MRQVTGNMTSVVKGMDKAMDSMNLERVRVPSTSLSQRILLKLIINAPRTDLARDGQV